MKVSSSNRFSLKVQASKGYIYNIRGTFIPTPSPRFNLPLRHRPNPRNHQTRPNIHHPNDPKDPGVIIPIIPSDQQIHYPPEIARRTGNASNET